MERILLYLFTWLQSKHSILNHLFFNNFNFSGEVFDVTKGRGWYGKGGSYHHFSGKDAARAYVTGCFQDHLTHDLRGLNENELKGVAHWKKFYENHHTYHKIGRVIHDPIPQDAPLPKPCKSAMKQKPQRICVFLFFLKKNNNNPFIKDSLFHSLSFFLFSFLSFKYDPF